MKYPNDIVSEILMTNDEIQKRAKEIAYQINEDYKDKDLILICTLKGATFFFSDVCKYVDLDCKIQFLKASSYIGNATISGGDVKISDVNKFDVKGKDILIIEDIVDTGLTCEKLFNHFNMEGCNSVNVCTLLDKPSRRVTKVTPKYTGKEIDDKFVIGYGLDYNEKYRNLPFVGVINKKYI